MKPNKDTEYTEFTEWSEKLCEKRHDKLVELRKEKCRNNPFKKWFYLGKKVKITKYKIINFILVVKLIILKVILKQRIF